MSTLKILINEALTALKSNRCYLEELRETLSKYNISISNSLHNEIKNIYHKLESTGDAEAFFASYYSIIVLFADTYFLNLEKHLCTLLATKTGDKIFCYFKTPSQFPHEAPTPISEKEMNGLQYLAGYVVKRFLRRAKNSRKYQSAENQTIIGVLTNAIASDTLNQKLIETQNRGGLTGVVEEFQQIFLRAEMKFRIETTGGHLRQIDIRKMTYELLVDSEIVSFYNGVVDNSDAKWIDEEVKINLLENILGLYLRVRAFSFTRDIVSKQKLSQKKTKAKGLRKGIKKATNKPGISE